MDNVQVPIFLSQIDLYFDFEVSYSLGTLILFFDHELYGNLLTTNLLVKK